MLLPSGWLLAESLEITPLAAMYCERNILVWLHQRCTASAFFVSDADKIAFRSCCFQADPWFCFPLSMMPAGIEEMLPKQAGIACWAKGRGVVVPVAGHTAARSLAVLLRTLQTSPACEPCPLLATQSALAASVLAKLVLLLVLHMEHHLMAPMLLCKQGDALFVHTLNNSC